jgi:hypothetical protein
MTERDIEQALIYTLEGLKYTLRHDMEDLHPRLIKRAQDRDISGLRYEQ